MALEAVLSNDWSALSELIDEALALPLAERDAWLRALGGVHAAHRDTLRALLATQAEVETGDFLAELPMLPNAAPAPAHEPPAAGHLVGAYRLIELQKALSLHLAEYDPVHSPATAQVRLALAQAGR